jgi:hypothetical protein
MKVQPNLNFWQNEPKFPGVPGAGPATAARVLDRVARPNPRIERWQPGGNWVVSAANFGSERELSRRRCSRIPAARVGRTAASSRFQRQLPVLTQGVPAYDVLVAADESEVFASFLPYRTWDPRPVAGSAGLVAVLLDVKRHTSSRTTPMGADQRCRFGLQQIAHRQSTQSICLEYRCTEELSLHGLPNQNVCLTYLLIFMLV